MASRITEWHRLPTSLTELCIETTLRCGQSFRWKHNDEDDSYACSLRGRIIQLKQDSKGVEYRTFWPAAADTTPKARTKKTKRATGSQSSRKSQKAFLPPTPPSSNAPSSNEQGSTTDEDGADARNTFGQEEEDDTRALITHYLNLSPNLSNLYTQWSDSDANFKKKAPRFTGVRILRQDSWEALVCFICSSNNNIARIGQMVEKLCAEYGPYIGTLDEQRNFFDFPGPERLLGAGVESRLRELGFGYRARYIAETARIVHDRGGKEWLDTLRNPEAPAYGTDKKIRSAGEMKPDGRDGYRSAHEALLELQGVGPKVADCVCLMGLAWGEAVPVDTHVWQIAQRDYKFGKGKHSSLTKATYDAVANHFRSLWGQEAGWAHSVLFTADLRVFAERLMAKLEVDADANAIDQTDVKKEIKSVAVKREFVETDDFSQPKLEIDEIAISTNEKVKRRRKG